VWPFEIKIKLKFARRITDFKPRGVEGWFNSARVKELMSVISNIRVAAAWESRIPARLRDSYKPRFFVRRQL